MMAYLGTILAVPYKKAPNGWMLCDGSSLPINGNEALYALLGTTYGGSGNNFNLPDLRNRIPFGAGTLAGYTVKLAQTGGTATTTLGAANLPPHQHNLTQNPAGGDYQVTSTAATVLTPAGALMGDASGGKCYSTAAPNTALAVTTTNASATLAANTGDLPGITLNTMPAGMTMNFIICTQGLYPVQS